MQIYSTERQISESAGFKIKTINGRERRNR